MIAERADGIEWKAEIGEGTGKVWVKRKWEMNREEWMGRGMVGISDANGISGRVGIGREIWLYGRSYKSRREGKGYGLTVGEGEMVGVAKILEVVGIVKSPALLFPHHYRTSPT